MSRDVRFGWLGESRCDALLVLLTSLTHDWVNDWWVNAADGVIEVGIAEQPVKQDGQVMALVASSDEGKLAIYPGGKDFDAIGRLLSGVTNDANTELAWRVGRDALADLAEQIRRRAGLGMGVELIKGAVPSSLTQARLGAFSIAVAVGRLQLQLSIDRGIADRLVPPLVLTHSATLVSRHAALQQAPLKVFARMDFGSVDLAHLSDLGVGEILIGDRKLDENLHFCLEGHGAVATGYLRRSGEQRAIVLDDTYQQERQQP